jgi:hypothetical protein
MLLIPWLQSSVQSMFLQTLFILLFSITSHMPKGFLSSVGQHKVMILQTKRDRMMLRSLRSWRVWHRQPIVNLREIYNLAYEVLPLRSSLLHYQDDQQGFFLRFVYIVIYCNHQYYSISSCYHSHWKDGRLIKEINVCCIMCLFLLIPPSQIIGCFGFSRFIAFAMYLDICYV